MLDGMALRRHDAAVRADAKVGRRIKALRVERGMSQRDLAAPGMSYAYLWRIEAGQRTPSLSALIELADRLDTSALYLATGRTSGRCPLCGRT
jgi:transcriptional regulator with XRE-family HTH domain